MSKNIEILKGIDFTNLNDESLKKHLVEKFGKNINKTIVHNLNTIDTLYFMSLCLKGGICANSTFSGWGSTLNKNKYPR